MSRCRTVVMVHDLIPLRFPHRKSFLSLYFRYCLPPIVHQATHILCNSESTATDLIDFFQVPAQKITPIPLAYDSDRYRPLGLPRQPYLLCLSRPAPHKNLQRIILAFAMVAADLPCDLWLAGAEDHRYTPVLQRLVREKNLEDRVKFLGYVPDDRLPVLMNQAMALVFPSLWEGFGLPVLEAMACGTPVITANQSALPEVAAEAALLVDPYSVSAIANAMKQVVLDPTLWQQLQSKGLQRSLEFSWQKTGEHTQKILAQQLRH